MTWFDVGREARNFMVVCASGAGKSVLSQQLLAAFQARAAMTHADRPSEPTNLAPSHGERSDQGRSK